MKWFVTVVVIFLVIGVAITELPMIVYYNYRFAADVTYDFWWDKNYTEQITILWFIKEVSTIVKDIIWVSSFAAIAYLIDHRLFNVLIVFLLYYITQLALYLWNRNTSFYSNIIIYLYVGVAIISCFIPTKKRGKLINFDYDF